MRNISQDICDYIAISDVYQWSDILDRLVLQHLVERHPLTSTAENVLLSAKNSGLIDISIDELRESLDRLTNSEYVFKTKFAGEYGANGIAVSEVTTLFNKSRELENQVRDEWMTEIQSKGISLDSSLLWDCLIEFFVSVVKQHGLRVFEVVGFNGSAGSLEEKTILELLEAAASRFALNSEIALLRGTILDFFSKIEHDSSRGKFIAELAQGAFAWQSIHVPKEVATRLAGTQNSLTILLDTNFLIDLVGLSTVEESKAANQVLTVLKSTELDIKFRCLPSTENEFLRVVTAAKSKISRGIYSQNVSRALNSGNSLKGIEAAYVRARSKKAIRPEEFFLGFQNPRALFKNYDILPYQAPGDPTLWLRSKLVDEFGAYLRTRSYDGMAHREMDALEHDSSLLAHAILQRRETGSLLEARMLVLSCDRKLSGFDLLDAGKSGRLGVVVLPHVALQMVRPFINSDTYSRTLVDAVIKLEFRSLMPSGLGEEAHLRAISLLSCIEDLDEQQAVKLLSDKALMRNLEQTQSGDQAIELIKLASVEEAAELKLELKTTKEKLDEVLESLEDARGRLERETRDRLLTERAVFHTVSGADKIKSSLEDADERLAVAKESLRRANKSALTSKIVLVLFVVGGILWVIWSYGIFESWFDKVLAMKVAATFVVIGLVGLLFDFKDRKFWIGTIILPIAIAMILEFKNR